MALVDFFLKIEGIDGESQDGKHKGEIDLESWSWGATQGGTHSMGGGGGAGKVQMHDLSIVKKIDKSSTKLFLACANGEHIKKAVLVARKAGKDQQEYFKMTLTDLLVSSFQSSGHGQGDALPVDQISLNFAKVEVSYKEQKADGSLGGEIKAGWDVKANKMA